MGFQTKKVDLDSNGAGSVTVGPCFYVGATEGNPGDLASAVIVADGYVLGTALLARGSEKSVAGRIDVTGGVPLGAAVLYLDTA